MSSPQWLDDLLGVSAPTEGASVTAHGHKITTIAGITRSAEFVSAAQEQTRETFGFKWAKRDTFEGSVADHMRNWLVQKYGDVPHAPWFFKDHGPHPIILDAGCGAALSGIALFGPVMDRVRYLGVDVSTAVDVAKKRFEERGWQAGFIQSDLNQIPVKERSVDIVFSEGVLHHTDDTFKALEAVTKHVKVGGRVVFYVYRKKGPVREYTDDYIRDKLQRMTPEEGWKAMEPLSELGKILGDLNIEIDIKNKIDLLEIPVGKINLQRFFYWHVLKAFYRPEMTLDEMNHINFDWYAPKNARRHTVEDVRGWCKILNLEIEHEFAEEAGISVIARLK
ncbi:MAG: class I SAM-dependent methyltransferase [Alphaproteobacteria bacterium]|nr:class I SAM-dependent methyltransferase [Alphaproteobacteria bacterium]